MNRMMKRSTIVILLLMVGLLATLTGPVLAKATKTAVEGRADFSDGFIEPGEMWFDGGGNLHYQKVVVKGNFTLHGDGVDIDGKQIVVLNGILDETLTGPFFGAFSVSMEIAGEETVIWEGQYHGYVTNLSYSGQATAHGRGPFEGMQLKFEGQEDPPTPGNPDPNVFGQSGWILDPHGQ
jgi:hypothetical protein